MCSLLHSKTPKWSAMNQSKVPHCYHRVVYVMGKSTKRVLFIWRVITVIHFRVTLERNSEQQTHVNNAHNQRQEQVIVLFREDDVNRIEYITWVGYSVYIYNRERFHGLGISLKFTLARITFSYSNHNSVLPFQYALGSHSRDRENSFLFGTTVDTIHVQALHRG